jgi:hypothetical protein
MHLLFNRKKAHQISPESLVPPSWTPAPEIPHQRGLLSNASAKEWEEAKIFCRTFPPEPARFLSPAVLDKINAEGCGAWSLETPNSSRFKGRIVRAAQDGSALVHVVTLPGCKDTSLLSDLPIVAGLYGNQGKMGIYYEIKILRMNGIIAVGEHQMFLTQILLRDVNVISGCASRPYPNWRLPGWERLSLGLHLDDFRKFFEDPFGGRDYDSRLNRINPGDTIGFGYQFSTTTAFFTWNGIRLHDAFAGIFLPHEAHDVYAAVGVEGENEFEVNFGVELFRWKEGNEKAWKIDGHIGYSASTSGQTDEELPPYSM